MTIPPWLGVLLLFGALNVAAGLASYALGMVPPPRVADAPPPDWNLAAIVTFSVTAMVLLFGGRGDRRAVYLGGLYLLIATAFADHPTTGIARSWPRGAAALFHASIGAEVDAFVPLLLWLFAREFPQAPAGTRLARVIRVGILVSLVSALVLLAANTALALEPLLGISLPATLDYTSRTGLLFHGLVLSLSVAALPPIVAKARAARASERRRVGLFGAALAFGLGPVAVTLLAEALSAAYRRLVTTPSVQPFYDAAIYLLLMSVPMMTTYAVLVQHVLDVKLVVRRALRYALTRYGVLALTSVPFAALAVYIYRHRSEPLTAFVAGPRPLVLAGMCLLGLIGLLVRRRLLDGIDRRFFREHFDARRILVALVDRTRSAATGRELADLLSREIDRALHVETVSVLMRDPAGRALVEADGGRALPTSSTLARLTAGCAEPLDVNVAYPRSPLRRLPEEEREWLAAAGVRLLVPMLDSQGTLVGLITVGAKRSELPFDRDDLELLAAIAAAGALTTENLWLRAQPPPPEVAPVTDTVSPHDATAPVAADELAAECPRCLTFHPPATVTCASCGRPLVPGAVPYTLAGKFRIQALIGAGGMGVVYLARDLTLDRFVAIKTLPRVSSEFASRLRREARAAAAISHPNLATIFGVETWRGIPMLIFEFVQSGTLADRLASGKYPAAAVRRLGLVLADVLEQAHRAGVVHGDVKPTNIGFQRDDTIKLLDFGVARLVHDSALPISDGAPPAGDAGTLLTGELAALPSAARATRLFGTLAYLPPEALGGEAPNPAFDLWSLALVMCEALIGRNPMAGESALETMRRISDARLPDLRAERPDCPSRLAEFLARALSKDPADRPRTAKEFHDLLQEVSGDRLTAAPIGES